MFFRPTLYSTTKTADRSLIQYIRPIAENLALKHKDIKKYFIEKGLPELEGLISERVILKISREGCVLRKDPILKALLKEFDIEFLYDEDSILIRASSLLRISYPHILTKTLDDRFFHPLQHELEVIISRFNMAVRTHTVADLREITDPLIPASLALEPHDGIPSDPTHP